MKHKAFIFSKRSMDIKDIIFFCLYLIVHTVGGQCRQKCFSANTETLSSYLTFEKTSVRVAVKLTCFCEIFVRQKGNTSRFRIFRCGRQIIVASIKYAGLKSIGSASKNLYQIPCCETATKLKCFGVLVFLLPTLSPSLEAFPEHDF